MLLEVIQRLDYYKDLAGEPNVSMDSLKALKHPNMPNTYFIYVSYYIGDGLSYKNTEILEYLDSEDGVWRNAKNDLKDTHEIQEFIMDCQECNF